MSARKLRQRLLQPGILVVPGGGSPLEIKLIEAQGFDAAYLSGYATAAQRFAVPDIGLIAYGEIEEAVHATTAVTDLPLIVDCDTGYGDLANVRRTVRGLEAAGVAAIQIEDQAWPKRCGHMEGKVVEPREIAIRKVRAAVDSRRSDDLLIVARTDARAPHGMAEALDRCHAFKAAGADILFVDAPESLDEVAQIARELPGPVLVNLSESGKTPLCTAADLEQLGVKIALFPSSAVRIAVKVLGDFFAELKRTGDSRPWLDRMASLDATNDALGLRDIKRFETGVLEASRHD
jgi:2,3-dimethylmalate lyase